MNIGGIHLALDDVKARDVAGGFCRCCRDETILRLKKTTHHVEGGGFPD